MGASDGRHGADVAPAGARRLPLLVPAAVAPNPAPSCDPGRGVIPHPYVPLPIACHVSHRPEVGMASDDRTVLWLTGPRAQRAVVRGELEFTATYSDDGEGRTLNVGVKDGGRTVASGIYQLRRDVPAADNFVGGNGFTGLTYVNGRDGSGLQYWCVAEEPALR